MMTEKELLELDGVTEKTLEALKGSKGEENE